VICTPLLFFQATARHGNLYALFPLSPGAGFSTRTRSGLSPKWEGRGNFTGLLATRKYFLNIPVFLEKMASSDILKTVYILVSIAGPGKIG
jgi:hypothetical protein